MENSAVEKKVEPYSLFFSLGLFSAFLGSFLWFAFQHHWISFFPRQAHGNLMFFGFLWAYVAGFLMTAIPKMTRTSSANYLEIFLGMLFVFLQWAFNFRNGIQMSFHLYGLQMLFLLVFIGRRFLDKKQVPFEGFVFIPFAFFSAFLGIGYWLFTGTQDNTFFYLYAGQAFILNLICGLGSRLIPVITRVPAAVNPDVAGEQRKFKEYFFLALLLNLGFWLESGVNFSLGNLLKTLVIGFMAVRYFRVFKMPATRSFLGWGIRLAVFMLVLGYGMSSFQVESSLALLHLVYIGGFSLVTIMISTRVTLAHGPQDTSPELDSKALVATFVFFALAGLARVLAGQNLTGLALSFSIAFFVLALGAWTYRFLKDLLNV